MDSDRDFGIIEKRKRATQYVYTPQLMMDSDRDFGLIEKHKRATQYMYTPQLDRWTAIETSVSSRNTKAPPSTYTHTTTDDGQRSTLRSHRETQKGHPVRVHTPQLMMDSHRHFGLIEKHKRATQYVYTPQLGRWRVIDTSVSSRNVKGPPSTCTHHN